MRSLEDHISPQELASLPESPAALASGGPEQQLLLRHLQQCEGCLGLAQTLWGLSTLRAPSLPGETCPSQDVWLALAAGLRPGQSSSLLVHAAGCRSCALFLKEAMEFMQPDQLEESQMDAPIKGLASATPAWQRSMVAQMVAATASSQPPDTTKLRRRYSLLEKLRLYPQWITIPAASAVLCGAVVSGITLWRFAHPSDAQLLAEAYNKQRTLVLRIPGGEPVPLASGTRGPGDAPIRGLSDPTALIELRLRAQKHLDQTPNSPYWHQIMGEIDLLEQDGVAARRNFEFAQATDPKAEQTLPNLIPDLAAAWFEIGDKSGNIESYAEAAELYSRELRRPGIDKHPSDASRLYYSRALCWERQSLIENALDDLRAALSVEPSPSWRKAIQGEIDRLAHRSATTPTDGYENLHNEALSKLLPLWSTSSEAREKITRIAALGLNHHDHWLIDWIHTKHTLTSEEADRRLATAIMASQQSHPDLAYSEARSASDLYRRTGFAGGVLEAESVETKALQQLVRSSECVELAAQIGPPAMLNLYPFLHIQTMLAQGACIGRSGDYSKANAIFLKADTLCKQNHFPLIDQNAVYDSSEIDQLLGLPIAAWKADVSVLYSCETVGCSARVRYSSQYDLVTTAQTLNQPLVATEVMRTTVKTAETTGNPGIFSFALEELALVTGQIGDYQKSAQVFDEAIRIRKSVVRAADGGIIEGLWNLDRADIDLKQGNLPAARELLRKSEATFVRSDYQTGRVRYLDRLAFIQSKLGQTAQAVVTEQSAIGEAEKIAASLRSTSDIDNWSRQNTALYGALADLELQQGNNTGALEVWERFKSFPYKRLSKRPRLSDSVPIVVIAHVGQSYVGWFVRRDPMEVVHATVLGSFDQLHPAVEAFYRLCSDPDSNLTDIHLLARQLYTSLIRPFDQLIRLTPQIGFDLDPSLSILPVAALEQSDGNWFGNAHSFIFTSPWWFTEHQPPVDLPKVSADDPILIVNGFPDFSESSDEEASLAKLFIHRTVIDTTHSDRSTILHQIGNATIFHFTGHAAAGTTSQLNLRTNSSEASEVLAPDAVASTNLHRCRIAVLAACNTTAADPDRVETLFDLRTAFLASGAGAVLASNWNVDDVSTRSMMVDFYREILRGRPNDRALQSAQQAVRSRTYWKHPFYWAAFELFNQ